MSDTKAKAAEAKTSGAKDAGVKEVEAPKEVTYVVTQKNVFDSEGKRVPVGTEMKIVGELPSVLVNKVAPATVDEAPEDDK